jgi:hypothetical protein
MNKLRDLLRDERGRRKGLDRDPLILMRVVHEPVLSPEGSVIGGRELDTGASAVICGRPGGRFWQEDGETIDAFEARVQAIAAARP